MEQRFQKWEKARAKGKPSYVLLYGVLTGVISAVLVTLLVSLLTGLKIFRPQLIINLVLFPLIGIGCADITWVANEKAYLKMKGSEPDASPNSGPAESSRSPGGRPP